MQLHKAVFLSFSGSKSFAIYSRHATLLIVVAKKSVELKNERDEDGNDIDDDDSEFDDPYITFAIDAKSSGITICQERPTIGCNDVPFATVDFRNVQVRAEHMLCATADDRKISEKLIASSRLQSATLNMIVAKNMFNNLINFAINTDCNAENLR